MALEPITRQEKIIAGQDLTPITRMEMFLKNFGGGGGGSVPKPLTYDYMPEGYPSKSGWSIEWDGNTEGLVPVFDAYFKVSDLVPTDDELIGSIVELSNGEKIELTSDLLVVSEGITSADGDVVVVKKDNAATPDGITFPQKGTYFNRYDGPYTAKLSKQTITTMAEEFMPVIPSDKMPTVPYLLVNSSTTNSTKVFKLTVDDSGAISATEVTA